MAPDFSAPYPVSSRGSGRRRRMLVMQTAAVESVPAQTQPTAPSRETAPAPMASPPARKPDAAASTAISRIRELIDDTQPHTWVFTGDSFGFETEHARRSWTEHFNDVIRDQLSRNKDVVLDTSSAGSSFGTLLKNLDWQVLRFQPDAVVISAGPEDVRRAQANSESLRDALIELADLLHHEGCVVVLCSPPQIVTSTSERMKPLLQTLQSVADKCEAVFVNHYAAWSQHQTETGSILELLNSSGMVPSAAGHRKLARDLVAELRIG